MTELKPQHIAELGKVSAEILALDERREQLQRRRQELRAIIATLEHVERQSEQKPEKETDE